MKSPTLSNESVQKATGKSRREWFSLLETINAQHLPHKETAQKLVQEFGVPGWWAQGITVEFERAIGRRVVGQTHEGDFQAAATTTLSGSMDDVLMLWQNQIKNFGDFNEVKFSNKPSSNKTDKWRYWRVNLEDGSKVAVIIGQKPTGKIHLAVNHEKLPDSNAVERWKLYWKAFLKDL